MNTAHKLARYMGYSINAAILATMTVMSRYGFTAGAGDYLPNGDADLQAWALNFSTHLTATPAAYGLVAGDATAYAALYATYNTALIAATADSTRTPVTIAAKDTARAALVAKTRDLVNIIQAAPVTTDAGRAELQITIPNSIPSPIPAPTTKPVVNVEDIQNLAHLLRVRDELTPTSNSKPDGAIGAEVWCKIGPVAPVTLTDCTYLGLATTRFFTANQSGGDVGKQAYYMLRWINAKAEHGPTSDMISATIASA